jgi:hypothetical protein
VIGVTQFDQFKLTAYLLHSKLYKTVNFLWTPLPLYSQTSWAWTTTWTQTVAWKQRRLDRRKLKKKNQHPKNSSEEKVEYQFSVTKNNLGSKLLNKFLITFQMKSKKRRNYLSSKNEI